MSFKETLVDTLSCEQGVYQRYMKLNNTRLISCSEKQLHQDYEKFLLIVFMKQNKILIKINKL